MSIFAATSTRAAGPFDGTYNGTTQQVGGLNSPSCASNGSRVQITVADNALTYNHFGSKLTGTVAANGSFTASGTNLRYKPPVVQSITGTISGGSIDADTGASGCQYHVSFKKS